jgi:hypothetical protein
MDRVNNKKFDVYQDGEIYIELTPKDLEHAETDGTVRVYLTVLELERLLTAARGAE